MVWKENSHHGCTCMWYTQRKKETSRSIPIATAPNADFLRGAVRGLEQEDHPDVAGFELKGDMYARLHPLSDTLAVYTSLGTSEQTVTHTKVTRCPRLCRSRPITPAPFFSRNLHLSLSFKIIPRRSSNQPTHQLSQATVRCARNRHAL